MWSYTFCYHTSLQFFYWLINYGQILPKWGIVFIVVGSRRLMPPDALQPKAYCTKPGLNRSYFHRQVSPPETLVVKGGTNWARNGGWILPENARLPRNIQGSFTRRKSTTWDKWLYFPSEGVLRNFSPWKIRRLRPSLNPRTWVPKASTLPLEHRSRCLMGYTKYLRFMRIHETAFILGLCYISTFCVNWN